MTSDPILEEIWRIKDELAQEAGNDIHRLCANTRRWAAEHPHSGPIVRNAHDLRRLSTHTKDGGREADAWMLRDARAEEE